MLKTVSQPIRDFRRDARTRRVPFEQARIQAHRDRWHGRVSLDDWPEFARQNQSSGGSAFERLGAEATQMAVAARTMLRRM